MDHAERYNRRKTIAEFVKNGMTVEDAAEHYGLSLETVLKACREHKVTIPSQVREISVQTYSIIADLFGLDYTFEEIGSKYNLTRQRIGHIYKRCVKAGIPVPLRVTGPKPKKSSNETPKA